MDNNFQCLYIEILESCAYVNLTNHYRSLRTLISKGLNLAKFYVYLLEKEFRVKITSMSSLLRSSKTATSKC